MTPDQRLAELAEGKNPALVARMESGFVLLSESQFLPGYCLLIAYPKVLKLNDLTGERRSQFLTDMADVGDAVLQATGCVRINYSIYGNLDPFLHAHVIPRFADEEERFRTIPPMSIPAEIRNAPEHAYDPARHAELQAKLRTLLRG
jgi:diadenosine tetraphosphate (Ap4A) HIT family hydrolase